MRTPTIRHLDFGDVVRMEDLSEQDARQIFGDIIYEAWVKGKNDKPSEPLTVVSVDHKNNAITVR